MRIEQVHTLILGAGPAGLAAGYKLAKAGLAPLLLERDKVHGGLMRSIHRGEFVVDVGRKELYNRLAKVDAFWGDLLGGDYRPYPHRGGILYDGHIIEMSPAHRGFFRGMPLGMFFGCTLGFLGAQLRLHRSKPKNLEEYFYQKRGRRLTQIATQGFQEKLNGRRWADIPLPENLENGAAGGIWSTMRDALARAVSRKEVNTFKGLWRHPAKGTGQICDALAQGIREAGGRFLFEARLLGMTASEKGVNGVTAEIGSEKIVFEPKNVVSSIPLELLAQYLLPDRYATPAKVPPALDSMKRTVVLVYLFLDEAPRFPHAWLQVTCPKIRVGRIANYTGFNGGMVPPGKTCLCCEYYCFGADPFLELKDEQIAEKALEECSQFKLVDRAKCFDRLVLRFRGADASQNRHNWMSQPRVALMKELRRFENLYFVGRTDLDIATLAGIEAAEAILSGARAEFDRHMDPTQIGIRSEGKPFEFKSPIRD